MLTSAAKTAACIGIFLLILGPAASSIAHAADPSPFTAADGTQLPGSSVYNALGTGLSYVGSAFGSLVGWGASAAATGAGTYVLLPALTQILSWLATVCVWFLSVAAWGFDAVTALSLNGSFYALDFLTTSWSLVLSIANMAFIFLLIYIAFTIMLQAETTRTMQMLAWVIVIALVVNFSFFFTRVVIDAGNILAVQFYNATASLSAISAAPTVGGNADLTAGIMNAVGFQQLLGSNSFAALQQINGSATNAVQSIVYLSIIVVCIILFSALITAAAKFFIRIVGLWFVLIASPVAFVSKALPKTSRFFETWFRTLIGFSFYPAVFLFIFFILTKIAMQLGGSISLLQANQLYQIATGADSSTQMVGLISGVVIRLGFVVVSLFIGLKVTDWITEQAGGLAMNIMNRGSSAIVGAGVWGAGRAFRTAAYTGAAVGRNTFGRAAYGAVASGKTKEWKKQGGVWNTLKARTTERLSRGTYDVRNAPGGGLLKGTLAGVDKALAAGGLGLGLGKVDTGKASQRNFAKTTEEKAKEFEKMGKALKASDYEIRLEQERFKEEYDRKNGPGMYDARINAIAQRINRSKTRGAEFRRLAALEEDKKRQQQLLKLAGRTDKSLKQNEKELKPMAEAGKTAAEAKARARITEFAKRLEQGGAITGIASYGALEGASKVAQLAKEKSKTEKLAAAAAEREKEKKEEEVEETTTTTTAASVVPEPQQMQQHHAGPMYSQTDAEKIRKQQFEAQKTRLGELQVKNEPSDEPDITPRAQHQGGGGAAAPQMSLRSGIPESNEPAHQQGAGYDARHHAGDTLTHKDLEKLIREEHKVLDATKELGNKISQIPSGERGGRTLDRKSSVQLASNIAEKIQSAVAPPAAAPTPAARDSRAAQATQTPRAAAPPLTLNIPPPQAQKPVEKKPGEEPPEEKK